MGIKSLTQLIKKNSPNSIQHVGLYTMKDKRIAIDTSIFLYKSLINIRYKGDYLRNKDDYEINLMFSNNAHISLKTETIEVRLEDQNEIK